MVHVAAFVLRAVDLPTLTLTALSLSWPLAYCRHPLLIILHEGTQSVSAQISS